MFRILTALISLPVLESSVLKSSESGLFRSDLLTLLCTHAHSSFIMSETHKLDTLPVEIIRRITSHGPCESTLSLLKVNRALHSACNDRLVFKSIIDNGNGSTSDLPIWKCTLPLDSPVTLWARYALADSKACIMPSDASGAGGDRWNDFADVVPQLMASHRTPQPKSQAQVHTKATSQTPSSLMQVPPISSRA